MKKTFLPLFALTICLASCSKEDGNLTTEQIKPLPQLDNISLNYHNSDQEIELTRDIEKEGAILTAEFKFQMQRNSY